MSQIERAFYARRGSTNADLITILHVPYTIWHLSYVAIGAAAAPSVDWVRLVGTLVAFLAGLGVSAHALDEVHDRPLATSLDDRSLWLLAVGGLVVAAAVAIVGAFVISPWVLAWAAAGIVLATIYALEWTPLVHNDLGFGLAWGAFPALVGYWAQTETITLVAVGVAAGATVMSLVQRWLSKAAKRVRRRSDGDTPSQADLRELGRVELPLKILSWVMPGLAVLLLALGL